MELQEKWICPACGKVIKVDLKFCTYCGVNLSEFNEIDYDDFRDLRDKNAAACKEPLYDFSADVAQLFILIWF